MKHDTQLFSGRRASSYDNKKLIKDGIKYIRGVNFVSTSQIRKLLKYI